MPQTGKHLSCCRGASQFLDLEAGLSGGDEGSSLGGEEEGDAYESDFVAMSQQQAAGPAQ